MKRNTTIFLQIVIVLIGLATLAFLLGEPHLEGRNTGATLFEIYFKDPFLACVYAVSIAFFTALYQAFKVLAYARHHEFFSQASAKALRIIKHSAHIILGFGLGAEAYLMIVRPEDDIAGGVFMGLLLIAGSGIVAIAAKRFERIITQSL